VGSGNKKPPPATPRRPPPLPPTGADAFVRGEPTSDQPSERPDVQVPRTPIPAAPALPTPPAASPATDVQTSRRPAAQAPSPSNVPAAARSKAIVTRTSGVERRRLTVYLPPALAKRLAVYAAGAEVEMSEVAAEAIEAWLQARGA
jgi:hypothetical protein